MNCPKCNTLNDGDAQFCTECGGPLASSSETVPRTRKVYLYTLLLIPVLVIAAAVGYYKYFLPTGIAAVVNGEEIELAELDAEVGRSSGPGQAADTRLRYQVLNSLITERIVLQEARKAGVSVSGEELTAAVNATKAASGREESQFEQELTARYGSRRKFEEVLARRLLVNKFLSERVVPANADVRTSRMALDQWLQNRSAAASVRITLAEQWSGAACGCCANKGGAAPGPGQGAGNVGATGSNADRAANEGLRYWREKHGAGTVTARVKDLGCHMQVDIVKDNNVIGSLRYQAGAISEL